MDVLTKVSLTTALNFKR